ncbi:MAG TPA: transglutaminase-like cysteine peptidase [Devosia sp.]|nr:transglutaminase-like cysteine peptidase [Devosia sp.]
MNAKASGGGLLIVAALLSALSTAPAMADAKAPLGYQLMCLKTPAECKGGGASVTKASANTLALLKRVNAQVNAAITPRNDKGADVWNASASAGDCEDYVLAKRRALIRAGISASSLRIAYVKTSGGVGHAILVVKTSKGDFVLDNLRHAVRPLSQSGYRIISMSGANPMKWS